MFLVVFEVMSSVLIYVGLQSDANHHPEIGWLPWCSEDDCLQKTVHTRFAASERSKQNLDMHNASIFTMSNQHQGETNIYLRFHWKKCHPVLPPQLSRFCVVTPKNKMSRVTYECICVDLSHGQTKWIQTMICSYSGNTWLCVHWQWHTREWCH